MSYKSFLLQSPVFWLIVGGLFFGAAAAQLTIISRRTRDPAKTRRRKPTKIFLLLAAAIPSFTVAVILSLPAGVKYFPSLAAAGAAVLVGGIGLRFKKTAGVLLLVLAGLAGYGARSALREWTPVYGPVDAGSIKVLHMGEAETSLLVSLSGQDETVMTVPSRKITVRLEILVFADPYVLLGRKVSYKFAALKSGDAEHPFNAAFSGTGFAERVLYGLPGVEIKQVEAEMPPAELFSTYILRIDVNGGAAIAEK